MSVFIYASFIYIKPIYYLQVYLFSGCRTISDGRISHENITASTLGIIPRSDPAQNSVSYVDIAGSQVSVATTPHVDITEYPHSVMMLSCSRGKDSVSRKDGYLNLVAEQLRKGERDFHTMHRHAAAWIKNKKANPSEAIRKTTPEWRENLVRGSLLLPPKAAFQQ